MHEFKAISGGLGFLVVIFGVRKCSHFVHDVFAIEVMQENCQKTAVRMNNTKQTFFVQSSPVIK
jgi:hypothetical protein